MFYILLIILIVALGVIIGLAAAGKIPKEATAVAASIMGAFIIMLGAVQFMDVFEYNEAIPDTTSTETHDASVATSAADSAEPDTTEATATEAITTAETAEFTESETDSVDTAAVTADTKETTAVPQTETTLNESPKVPGDSSADSDEKITGNTPASTMPVDTVPAVTTSAESADIAPSETAPVEPAAPDYYTLAKEAYSEIVSSAAASIMMTPRGSGFVNHPFQRVDAYSPLTDVQKGYYDEILAAVTAFEAPVYLAADGHEPSDVFTAAAALLLARPDIQCYFRVVPIEDGDDVLGYEVRYFNPGDGEDVTEGDKSRILSDMAYLDAVCRFIVDSMPEGITVYDKYRYLASVLTLTTQYDMDYEHPHNNATAYGGIVGGKTICVGYSVSFEYLCAAADLYCTRVYGVTYAENTHMWNLAKLDSGTYYIDVTWSDNGVNKPCSLGWMKYFMITQEELLRDHIISDGTVATGT